MEKLIELLNEYDSWWSYDDYYWPFQYWQDSDAYHLCKYQLVSKEYWFIKWLVENDKIDIKKLVVKGEMRSWLDFDNKKWNEESGEEIWNKYYSELCLMLLSISDTPIDDLISYLK